MSTDSIRPSTPTLVAPTAQSEPEIAANMTERTDLRTGAHAVDAGSLLIPVTDYEHHLVHVDPHDAHDPDKSASDNYGGTRALR